MTARLDLGFVRSLENLPGALTRPQFEADPGAAQPRHRVRQRAAQLQLPERRLHLPAARHREPAARVADPAQLPGPLPPAGLRHHRPDHVQLEPGDPLRQHRVASAGHRNLLTAGFQYFATHQNGAQQQNLGNANAGRLIKNEVAHSNNYGLYGEDVFGITPAVSLVGGLRLQYSTREIRDRLFSDPFPDVDGNDSGSVDFFGASPKFGAIWQVTPTIQVYGNASRAYQPPLLLELTAPGQIPGTLDDLNATYAWQFEIGTRGSWGERASWDISVYDYEVWDAIQNVNVQPFPGAPFTIPRFQNIPRSRNLGVEVGLDVQLLTRPRASPSRLGQAADQIRARLAYTYSNFRFVNNPTFNNNFLPGAPEHFIRAEVRYENALGFYFAPQFENVPKRYFVNSTNSNGTSPYVLVRNRSWATPTSPGT